MKHLFIVLFVVSLFAVSIGCGPQLRTEAASVNDEMYEVYSAALRFAFSDSDNKVIRQISDRTNSQSSFSTLESRFSLPFQYELVNGAQVRKDFENLKSEQLIQKYPTFTGLILLSPVELAANGTNASVKIDYIICTGCGFDSTFYLKKDLDNWKVIRVEREGFHS